MTQLRTIIRRLEKQKRELQTIIDALRVIDAAPTQIKGPASLDALLKTFETSVIAGALGQANGNQVAAARLLKIGRDKLRYKMAKHRIG